MCKYVTIQGDMWDSIAKKVYGDERYMNALLNANTEYHRIWIFPANIELKCPDIRKERIQTLAPWRR